MYLFPAVETTLLLPGPVGDIEVMLSAPEEGKSHPAVAIICHPHPLFGGTMQNKVVSALVRTFRGLGLNTLRFNFRGVGKTQGVHDQGVGETADVLYLIDWVKKNCDNAPIWLAGFSFGAYVSARAATKVLPARLVSIAPQVSRFTDVNVSAITCPWVLVQGEKDEIVSPDEVFAWVETLARKPQVIRMPEATHFFNGQLVELRKRLEEVLALF